MYKRLIRLQLSTIAIIGTLTCIGPEPAGGQSSQPSTPLEDFQLEDPNDPGQVFTDRGGTGSLLNLLNRLQQVNGGRSESEFAEEQSEDFDAAVDGFRQKQQQQLTPPTQSTPDPTGTLEATP